MKKILLIILFLSTVFVFAKTYYVDFNKAQILDLENGDTIVLTNMPFNWGYNRIVLGFSSSLIKQSGKLFVEDCEYLLSDYYTEVKLHFNAHPLIIYNGISQKINFQWWVDNGSIDSKCIDRRLVQEYDSLLNAKMKNYIDLGEEGSITIYTGTSDKFKITHLPNTEYNILNIQISSLNDKPLQGNLYAGEKFVELYSSSILIQFDPRNVWSSFFELAFTGKQNIQIKWWASIEEPQIIDVAKTSTNFSLDSVETIYFFEKTPYTKNNLKLRFKKEDFVDGETPQITKYSHSPIELLKWNDSLVFRSDIYNIKAQLTTEKNVTMALPIDFDYDEVEDSIFVAHFNDSLHLWEYLKIDSVVNGYVYFQSNHFSFWSVCKSIGSQIKKRFVNSVSVICSMVNDFVDLGKWIINSIFEFYDKIVKFICGDIDVNSLSNLFNTSEIWDVAQGKIDSTIQIASILDTSINGPKLTKLTLTKENEVNNWKITNENLMLLLKSKISAQLTISQRAMYHLEYDSLSSAFYILEVLEKDTNRYKFEDYFLNYSYMLKDVASMTSLLTSCYGSLNTANGALMNGISDFASNLKNGNYSKACQNIFKGFGLVDHTQDVINCYADVVQFLLIYGEEHQSSFIELLKEKDELVLNITDVMTTISLLAWLDKTNFRNFALFYYKSIYDNLSIWLDFIDEMHDYNNISIKAQASLALYEYLFWGKDTHLKKVNKGLEKHYGNNGGFSEGMGYSEYIWENLAYILVVLKDIYQEKGEDFVINENFLKSPYYVARNSRPVNLGSSVEYIPIEADDGCTYTPDYRVWSKILEDSLFIDLANKYPIDFLKKSLLQVFGYSSTPLKSKTSLWTTASLWGSSIDGISSINFRSQNNEIINLSMINEAGNLWINGQGHDQQDNLSITLASSTNGWIIQDRGYSGFSEKSNENELFSRFNNHNVLTLGSQCNNENFDKSCLISHESTNSQMTLSQFKKRAENFTGYKQYFSWDIYYHLLDWWFEGEWWGIRFHGGSEAVLIDSIFVENEILGYTSSHQSSNCLINKRKEEQFLKDSIPYNKLPCLKNSRSILFFGETFWVIDRPNEEGAVWMVNSPKSEWGQTNMHLFASGKELHLNGVYTPVLQNANSNDYSDKNLKNYFYAYQDKQANSYVMMYPINTETKDVFIKTSNNYCPPKYQCFEKDNYRLVVSPRDSIVNLAEIFEINDKNVWVTGIVMGVLNDNKWKFYVLDGNLFDKNGTEIQKTTYFYKTTDYLPALPFLLLR